MHTHTMENYQKWNFDGTSKYSRKSKNANKHIKEAAEIKEYFAQIRKENKNLYKKLSSKEKSKKSKRKQYYSSSDSSNDSDSD